MFKKLKRVPMFQRFRYSETKLMDYKAMPSTQSNLS